MSRDLLIIPRRKFLLQMKREFYIEAFVIVIEYSTPMMRILNTYLALFTNFPYENVEHEVQELDLLISQSRGMLSLPHHNFFRSAVDLQGNNFISHPSRYPHSASSWYVLCYYMSYSWSITKFTNLFPTNSLRTSSFPRQPPPEFPQLTSSQVH
jgi:hypothetical protein